ncbi:hypothetical protein A2765_02110 [Candidatus Kaiserbacteria bacterium RIFCSPHIGHO2_01_FULL_56_24]|uniref:Uncharacterized protein n=1 Tax=Candidatus Kaiserbacteria bacterium RIFCSPHIGHO2_01_FULL_56_24 TaxID=1798487 RepID=A0A1F6DAU5_9BACT|nr:MAG: hypothetical protein A2765_02110 [Candidatus Kaiserbacteria bacterium RIFCSPHIGHO2_01_FULL_56_24]
MLKSALRHFPLVMVIIVSFAFIGFALAEESDVSANASVDASVTTGTRPMKPLDVLRAAKEKIQATAGANVQMRVDAKAQGQASTSGQRPAGNGGVVRLRALVIQHAGLVKARLVLAQRQFDRLIIRIESRIEKMKAEGKATASVEADLQTAKAADVTAKADVQAVADFIATVNDSSDRAATKAQLETLIKKAQASIKAAHAALAKVIHGLAGLATNSKIKADASATGGAAVDTSNE